MNSKLAALRERKNPYFGVSLMKGDKGEPGDTIVGPPGKTPVKGVDYFTPAEIDQLVQLVQSRVKDGEPGKPGRNGETPVRGIDFWSKEDQEAIIRDVLSRIPKPEIPVIDHQTLVEKALGKALASKPIKIEHIAGLDKSLKSLTEHLKLGGFRGGGGKVVAGTNTSVVSNADGSQIISATATGLTLLTATGVVDDSNTAFTFVSKPTLININGAGYRENHGWTWNSGTLTATLDNPVGTGGDIFGQS